MSEEIKDQKPSKGPARSVYLLPNLFTTSALFAGFYSIVSGINGDFVSAAIAIFVAQVFDILDGRIARMTNTQSEFGAQYDSLSDCVAFGLAPALLAFQFALHDLDRIGWICSFIFVAGAALRLARFNVQAGSSDKRFFTGLASPAAAAIVAASVWALAEIPELNVQAWYISGPLAFLVAGSGLLMVSNFRFYSFKVVGEKGKVPFVAMVGVVLVFAAIAVDPARVLAAMSISYAFSGPIFEAWVWIKRRNKKAINENVTSESSKESLKDDTSQ